MLAAGRFSEAASWFQEAIEGGAPPAVRADAHRELALVEVLRARVPTRRWAAVAAALPVIATTKGASLLAYAADGRFIVFDRKNDALQTFDAKGVGAPPVPLPEVAALAADPYGRVFAATKEQLVRCDAAGITVVMSLGSFGAPSAIAVDASGSVWIADRKGDRIARWAMGMPSPVVVRESKGAGVGALVVAGGRVIAAEEKTGRLIALTGNGSEATFGTATFRRPISMSVDAAGRIAVLDEKAETVTRLTPSGDVSDTLALGAGGVSHPAAIVATPAGAVLILDGGSGSVAVAP
jgi:streptogramin lyase